MEALSALFHERAVFVHMGATMTKDQEMEVIRTGAIQYKDIEIQETSVPFLSETTAILLNKIRLVAVVQGTEVSNPFVVTEVYVQNSKTCMLASLSVHPADHLLIPAICPLMGYGARSHSAIARVRPSSPMTRRTMLG